MHWPTPGHAETLRSRPWVKLSEVVPSTAGSALGEADLGPRPRPGHRRTLTRREVIQLLEAQGYSARGLKIPRRSTVRHHAADPAAAGGLEARTRRHLRASLPGCTLTGIDWSRAGPVAQDAEVLSAHPHGQPRFGRQSATLIVRQGTRTRRVAVWLTLNCPPPVITRGSHVRIVARVGAVRASTAGIAQEAGRVGEHIRVRNTKAKQVVEARVVDASTVEVTP
ncbi:MAG: flagellar basal body P-ring formation chaperone FlgA [Polyangiales bacterium]